MGDPCMHVLFVRLHAHPLPLDATSRTFLRATFKKQAILIALPGCSDLRGRFGPSRWGRSAHKQGRGGREQAQGRRFNDPRRNAIWFQCVFRSQYSLADRMEANMSSTFVANATEEYLVRKRPLYEVVGQLGMWGMIVNGIQASAIEHQMMKEVTWSGRNSPSPLSNCRI